MLGSLILAITIIAGQRRHVSRIQFVWFQQPGPKNEQSELAEVLGYLSTQYPHDFSGCQRKTARRDIPDIDDYERITIALVAWAEPESASDVFRHGLHLDTDPLCPRIQIAWCC